MGTGLKQQNSKLKRFLAVAELDNAMLYPMASAHQSELTEGIV
ncbi:hypothetical protein [Cyanobium sp. ATX 6A2]|nr:hypothetical protein [Cyanobium sp. ATX 6A2]